jgi:hypothetical protein
MGKRGSNKNANRDLAVRNKRTHVAIDTLSQASCIFFKINNPANSPIATIRPNTIHTGHGTLPFSVVIIGEFKQMRSLTRFRIFSLLANTTLAP